MFEFDLAGFGNSEIPSIERICESGSDLARICPQKNKNLTSLPVIWFSQNNIFTKRLDRKAKQLCWHFALLFVVSAIQKLKNSIWKRVWSAKFFLGRSVYYFVVKMSRVRSALGGFSSSVLVSEKLDLKFILGIVGEFQKRSLHFDKCTSLERVEALSRMLLDKQLLENK